MNEQRFWDTIDKRGPDECWSWQAHTNSKGYGQLRLAGKKVLSHRLVYCLHQGVKLKTIAAQT